MTEEPGDFFSHFRIIRDPRIERTKKHRLETILFIAICGVISGAESWVEIEQFGEEKKEWLARYVDLTNGIPSHDTFGQVFALLDPEIFCKSFLGWIQTIRQRTQGEVIAIDGKTVRRSHDRTNGKEALHLVHAWASENHLMLGQIETDEKSNEITAIPKLLQMLELRGAIVTLDAMGTQKEIAQTIRDQEGDYVMALKGKQNLLYEEVQQYWEDPKLPPEEYHEYETVDKGHGRMEIRRYRVSQQIDWLEPKSEWAGLKSIGRVEAERTIQGETSVEHRYYLTSLEANAQELARVVRSHWTIENNLHWALDISFREDESRVRIGHAAQNFALLRRMALALLKKDKASKVGIKARRLKAGWNPVYLESVLFRN